MVTQPPKCPLSLVNFLDITISMTMKLIIPSGECSLHHDNNLLDANLAKIVFRTEKVSELQIKILELRLLEVPLKKL